MAYPAGVITRPVTFGPAFELEDGDVAGMTVAFKATRPGVLWMATGSPAVSTAITRNADDGVEQTVYLPVTDQAGWGDGDGNAIVPGEDGHVFLYSVSVVFTQNGRTIPGAQPRSKTIAIPAGDLSPIDLDKIVPLTSPGGTVVSIPDIWSGQLEAAQAAAEAAEAAVIDSSAFVRSTNQTDMANPSSQLALDVAAKIATDIATPLGAKQDKSSLKTDVGSKIAESGAARDAVDARVTSVGDGRYAAVTTAIPVVSRIPRPALTTITSFQAGHGWTSSGGTWNLNDTSGSPLIGTQRVSITTLGNSAGNTVKRTGMTAVDYTNKQIAMLVYVDDVTRLGSIIAYFGTSNLANFESVTVVGASGVDPWTRGLRSGQAALVTVPFIPGAVGGTPNRAAVTDVQLRVADNGLPVRVEFSLLSHFPKAVAYPKGVVSFWLDDNYDAAYFKVRPILDAYGWAATMLPIIELIGASGRMTLAQMKSLSTYNGWDVGMHCYTLAAHAAGFANLTPEQVRTEMAGARQFLDANGFKGTDFFGWPLGSDSAESEAVVGTFASLGRHTYGSIQTTLPPDRPLRMRARVITAGDSLATLTAIVDAAYASGAWVNFVIHDVVDSGASGGTQMLTSTLTSLAAYIAAKGDMPVAPVGEVIRRTS